MNLSTTSPITSGGNGAKFTMASKRLRNSGLNVRCMAFDYRYDDLAVNPIDRRLMLSAPTLVVIITITCLNDAMRPLLSVNVPWSILAATN